MEDVDWRDLLVIAAYFVLVLAVGLTVTFLASKRNVKGYFLASREMLWLPVGASLYMSNIGSEHFIGLAGTGAASGIAIVMFEFSSAVLVVILGWLFMPVFIASGVYTMPGYLKARFGGERLRIYLSVISLLMYIVTKIAVCIYAGGLFIQLALGWNIYLCTIVLLAITGVYTILGGLTAVIFTDTLQSVIMLIGAVALTVLGFQKVNGLEGLRVSYPDAIPSTVDNVTLCGVPRDDAFNLFRSLTTGDLPWLGLILQSSIGCMWYWCCDQVIVQRALSSKNLSHAKGAAILCGYLKLLPLFIMIFPGMISRVLFTEEVACADPDVCMEACGNPASCSNIAYPKLVLSIMPIGLRGLMMAVMLSALMSSLTSIFNSASAIFTLDLYRRCRPLAAETELLLVGKVFVLLMCAVSVAWLPMIQSSQGGQLFLYIQAMQGYLGTPIGALFLIAILWKRINEKGAFWALLAAHVIGIGKIALDFSYPEPPCGEPDERPLLVSKVHFLYFGSIEMLIVFAVATAVSLMTKCQPDSELKSVTWWTRFECGEEQPLEAATEKVQKMDVQEEQSESSSHSRLFNVLCGVTTAEGGDDGATCLKSIQETTRNRVILAVNAGFLLTTTLVLCIIFR
ncbi:PREDICTED: sodium/glucose cotransporter 4-like [Priapulus caudatus]|uniref:Sodium/glucose cotransporter 4-like n=1 Tax=Priapulus caudatus TaxID=37621 RepID=A0ABM1EJN8_PRICU|nr:PREDICTED: sodium/glucose cotransporter 4-like [Priapulus caudatus]